MNTHEKDFEQFLHRIKPILRELHNLVTKNDQKTSLRIEASTPETKEPFLAEAVFVQEKEEWQWLVTSESVPRRR